MSRPAIGRDNQVNLVTRAGGSLWPVAGYGVLVAVVSLVCLRFLPETRGRDLTEDAAATPATRS